MKYSKQFKKSAWIWIQNNWPELVDDIKQLRELGLNPQFESLEVKESENESLRMP